jgi:LacI family transcriptional regulator
MIRLKDIAQQAGVSIMTVSKVLRDASDISVATKVRVKHLAQQMGYVPDSLAQGLRTRKTKLLGLVIPASDNPIFARIVLAIEERSYDLGYEIILAQSLNLPEREETVIRRLLSRRVDGIFIAPVYRLAPKAVVYEELVRRGIPAIILGHVASFCSHFVNIETEDRLASTSITQHLLRLGHERIAFFGGPVAAPWAQERLEGYRRALREAGIEVRDALIFSAGSSVEEGEKAALQFLNESPPATAIQSVNDQVAVGAANILVGQGIKIPQDLSITGFGNVLAGYCGRVPLTTIGQPKHRLGLAAMEMMSKLLLGQRIESRRLTEELIIRESTAPPAVL